MQQVQTLKVTTRAAEKYLLPRIKEQPVNVSYTFQALAGYAHREHI